MRTLDQVKEKANTLFTKPGLRERVQLIQDQFVQEKADGIKLIDALRAALIEQGEYDFEQEVKGFPFVVAIPKKHFTAGRYKLNAAGEPSPLFEEAETWLVNHLPADEYLAFPVTAIGQHKECCYNVYFKSHQWATYFKVGFTY